MRLTRILAAGAAVLALSIYVLSRYGDPLQKVASKAPGADALVKHIGMLASSVVVAAVFVPIAALLIECAAVGYERSSIRKLATGSQHAWRDALYAGLSFLPSFWLKVGFTLGVVYVTERLVAPHVSWNLSTLLPGWTLQYATVVLGGSLLQYWQHRILHMVPFLWETHKLHHSAVEMTTLNLMRESPFTTAVADTLIFVPLAMLGTMEMERRGGSLSGIDMAWMALFFGWSLFSTVNHWLIHSEIRASYGWFGRWVAISPAAHRVHHSALPEHWDKNFSVSLIIWDRLFGTFHEGAGENPPLGFKGNPYNRPGWAHALADYFWLPVRGFGAELARAIRLRGSRKHHGTPTEVM